MECFTQYYISDNTFDLCKKINDPSIYISNIHYLFYNNIVYYNDSIILTLFISLYEQFRFKNIHIYIYSNNKNIKFQFFKILKTVKKCNLKGVSFYFNKNIHTKGNNIIISDYNNTHTQNSDIIKNYYIHKKNFIYNNNNFLFLNNHSNYIITNHDYSHDFKLNTINKLYYYNTIYKSIIHVNDIITAEIIFIFFKRLHYNSIILTRDNIDTIDNNNNHRIFIIYDFNIINIFSTQVNFFFYFDIPLFLDLYIWRQQYLFNHTVFISFVEPYKKKYLKNIEEYNIYFREIYV